MSEFKLYIWIHKIHINWIDSILWKVDVYIYEGINSIWILITILEILSHLKINRKITVDQNIIELDWDQIIKNIEMTLNHSM